MSIALLFPGQGAQSPGFLHALPEHDAVYKTLGEASVLLHRDVLTLDTKEELASTVATQIAITVAGAAFAQLCAAEGILPQAVAGMSVGIYAAVIAAGCIDLSTALTLVGRRAELMEATFPHGTHGMAVVDGLRLGTVKALLQETEIVIANHNSATQYVLAGKVPELELLVQSSLNAGAHSAKMLHISVASHTSELQSQGEMLLNFSRQFPIAAPRVALYSNRTARALKTAEAVREELAYNMAYPVLWHDTLTALGALGLSLLIESPPGHTLTRLATSILPDVTAMAAGETRWDVILRASRRAI
jgi:malonate decarboxylase epsilon subunit